MAQARGGHGTGYTDLLGHLHQKATGSGRPTYATISGNFEDFKFTIGDKLQINYHIPHDYVPGLLYPHVHFETDGTSTAVVRWQVEYVYANGFARSAYNYASPGIVTIDQTPTGTPYTGYVSEYLAGINGSAYETDGMLKAIFSRITNGSGADNTDGVFVTNCDIHYTSTLSGGTTPLKAYPFY